MAIIQLTAPGRQVRAIAAIRALVATGGITETKRTDVA